MVAKRRADMADEARRDVAPLRRADQVELYGAANGIVLTFAASGPNGEQLARVFLPESVAAALRAALARYLALNPSLAGAADASREATSDHARFLDANGPEDEGTESPLQILTAEEGRQLFDRQARSLLDMSGDEFLRRYDAGEFDAVLDDLDHSEVMQVASLIPFGRQNPN